MMAFVIVSAFCTLYYNLPAHNDAPGGATDYAWQEHKFYSRGNEGFAWGKTNNEGYVNTYDYSEDTEVDILMMGSSHAEAFNVAMEESTAAVLGTMCRKKRCTILAFPVIILCLVWIIWLLR